MNKKNWVNIVTIFSHILFWAIICYFFYRNAFLRPPSINAMYKEFITVLFIAIVVYINYFFLIPKFYNSFKFKRYLFLTVLIVFAGGIGEFLLLKPNIIECYPDSLSSQELRPALLTVTILLIIRDFCFVLFFFIIRLYQDLLKKYMLDKKTISQKKHFITIMEPNTDPKIVNIKDIVFLSHKRNAIYYYLANGCKTYQYITLQNAIEILPEDSYARINRGDVIMFKHIKCWNEFYIQLNLMQNGKYTKLQITPKYQNSVIKKLQKDIPKAYTQIICDVGENMSKINDLSGEEMLKKVRFSLNKTEKKVILFIKKHPGCRVPDIGNAIEKSNRTIERIISELKKNGLIKHDGTTKSGGYYIIEKQGKRS